MQNNQLCLVLGANGFIGSHLVDELVSAGYQVRAFDLYTSDPQFNQSDQVEVIKGDIYDTDTRAKVLNGVNYVFHAFSATTPASSDNDPFTDIEKNLKPSIDIFQEAVDAGVHKIIYLSSGGAIYGHLAEEKPAAETDAATPVSPYGINKLAIENYLAYFNRKVGLEYVVYRLTNPYGPRQAFRNNQGVIPAFLGQMQEGQPLNVLGDGSATRDYIFIRDITKMITKSFAENTQQRIYNLGSGTQTSVNQIIEALEQVTGKKIEVNHQEEPKTFLKSAKISTERFTDEFGEMPLTDLKTGLQEMIH